MKNPIEHINKAFENKVRLGIMSVLTVNDRVDFKMLKELLELTDGNLAGHLKGLENMDYIQVQKQFVGRKPNTSYYVTENGRLAFIEHLNALERLLKSVS